MTFRGALPTAEMRLSRRIKPGSRIYIERGKAKRPHRQRFRAEYLIAAARALALESYRSRIIAATPCAIICCPRQPCRKLWRQKTG